MAEGLEQGRVNYFMGNDPGKWKANIPTYKAVVYKEIYPGIDMKFYGNSGQLEYDIIIKPGADPSMVRLSYKGIEGLKVTKEGGLEIILKFETRNPQLKQDHPEEAIHLSGDRWEADRSRWKIQNPKSEIFLRWFRGCKSEPARKK